jgi:outer membrane protein assembly complex protein YaeT
VAPVWKALILATALSAPPVLAAQDIGERQLLVTGLRFKGNRSIEPRVLAAAISTSKTSWNLTWFLNPLTRWLGGTRRYLDEDELRNDVLRLQLFYRQHGFYDARIDTTVNRSASKVNITFHITEGPPTVVDTVVVLGVDSVESGDNIDDGLPLEEGDPFNRFLFQASADTVVARLRNRGYPFAQIFRSYAVDRDERRARAEFDVLPGSRARIGEIVVEGLDRISPRTVLRAMRTRPGRYYNQQAIFDSQRALYQRDLFRYVSIGMADDSLVNGVDSLVRLVVRVVEAEQLTMRNGIGYGTIDCLRTSSNVSVRNFLGEGRLLEVVGRLSKIGVGRPLDFGMERSLCRELRNDVFSQRINYQLTASITQPAAIIPRSTISLSGFAERRSEFNAYLHESFGGGLGLRIGFGGVLPPVSVSYRLSTDQTDANEAVFCVFFDQCDPGAIAVFRGRITQGRLGAATSYSSLDNPLEPTSGRVLSLELMHASKLVGSEVRFDRAVGEAIQYFPLGGRRTLATRLRIGVVNAGRGRIGGDTIRYVPPPDRFYAGGPTTVRGFGRNEMGPVVYVTDSIRVESNGDTTPVGVRASPTGSAGILLLNGELRWPTPLLAGKLSLAAYVDIGRLWEQIGARIVPGPTYVTPGVGLQFSSPLGPMRLDAAYNDKDGQLGRLYHVEGNTLTEISGGFQRQRGEKLLSRMQFHFSVGVPF